MLVTGFLGVFGAIGLGRFGYSAILPSMQNGLQISSASAGALQEVIWYISIDYPEGYTLSYSCFTNPWLSDKYRIILGSTCKYL